MDLKPVKALVAGLVLSVAGMSSAGAAPVSLTFDFTGGFDLSVNGGAAAPSGRIVFNALLDSTTPDLAASTDRGHFEIGTLTVTAAALGLLDEFVVAPDPIFVDTFVGGMTIIGDGFDPDIGWNGGPAPSTFMSDINDLSTLPLSTVVTMASTFYLGEITLANGDTLAGTTGANAPDGTFSAAPRAVSGTPTAVVPLPAAFPLALFAFGLLAAVGRRRTA